MQNQNDDELKKFKGLWSRINDNGRVSYSGKVLTPCCRCEVWANVYPNTRKQEAKHPDFNIRLVSI
jgi:uncharacterized protein (DUF736 family)